MAVSFLTNHCTYAAYDVGIARLIRKYGGKRREVKMRLEELEKFRGVRMGNANDLERFAELLDTLMVMLRGRWSRW